MFPWRFMIFLVVVTTVYGFDRGYASLRPDTCWQLGTQCSEDCTSILFFPGPGISPILSVNCSLNSEIDKFCYFDGVTPTCTADSTGCAPFPENLPFQCTVAGEFPDPYNCGSSYTCASGNPNATNECNCPLGSVWIGNTAECSTDADDLVSCCQDVPAIVNCDDNRIAGSFGACPWASLGYFYVCIRGSGKTAITVLKCPEGQVFQEDTLRCVDVCFKKGKTMITGISSKVQPVCSSSPPKQCNYPGQVLPVPNSCDSYLVCDENLQPLLRKCEEGSILDCSSREKCVCVLCSGKCPESCPGN